VLHHHLIALSLAGGLAGACAGLPDDRIASTVDVEGRSATYEGMVTVAEGAAVREGETCRVRVDRTDSDVWSCRVRVLCGGEMLYGLADAGYNRCQARRGEFVAAEDRSGTRRDGDPRMRFDLERGRIVVSDDDPDIEVVVALRRR
jgi:hypothetical protein